MLTTTEQEVSPTITQGGDLTPKEPNELNSRYQEIVSEQRLNWTSHLHLHKRLGAGGQGVVYLTQLRGTDEFTLPAALKIFSPERFDDAAAYDDAMVRVARSSARIAQIQHDNLLYVYNFVDRRRIRMLVMEWIDGYDLQNLLTMRMLERMLERSSQRRWEYINRVIFTAGPTQPRLKPGMAVAVIRDCLSGLAALHRHGIVHGDIKPSNIMLKRTGIAKIIDIGSAFEYKEPPKYRPCTPAYAAPEVLENRECTPRSDLCSLGYVLIEMLAGCSPVAGVNDLRQLLEVRRNLPARLPEILPAEVVRCELLLSFIRGMIAPDPVRRFPSAEAADLLKEGAAAFQRQLVIGDLAAEYPLEIREWLDELKGMEAHDVAHNLSSW